MNSSHLFYAEIQIFYPSSVKHIILHSLIFLLNFIVFSSVPFAYHLAVLDDLIEASEDNTCTRASAILEKAHLLQNYHKETEDGRCMLLSELFYRIPEQNC